MQIDYENLVFEGGGVCSFAYCGAISELEKMEFFQKSNVLLALVIDLVSLNLIT